MRTIAVSLLVIGATACAKPKPKVTSATPYAFLVGKWRGVDRDGWVFNYQYTADRRFTLHIDQLKASCDSAGTFELLPSEAAVERIELKYDTNTCNSDYVGRTAADHLTFAGDGFSLADADAVAENADAPRTTFVRAE